MCAVPVDARSAPQKQLGLVGSSPAMRALRRELRLAAEVPSTILLQGETGSGKGVAARAVHALSPRADEPFVSVDCAALAPTLLESELFGHERGSFTGATERRLGRLERAGRGSLFLDEIAELAPGLQAKLLRALEERRFERVGGGATLPVAARIIAATNEDLERAVRAGRFRSDLFFRLDVLRIVVPPLRERLSDLPELIDHLLARTRRRLGQRDRPHEPELVRALAAHDWPGNVRELGNRLEALLVRAPDAPVEALRRDPQWPPSAHTGPRAAPQRAASHERSPADGSAGAGGERDTLAALLEACGGNVARVARRLGRPRSTVRYQIQRYGLATLVPRD